MNRSKQSGFLPWPLLTARGFAVLAAGALIPLAGLAAAAPLTPQLTLLGLFLGCVLGLIVYERIIASRIYQGLTLTLELPAVMLSNQEVCGRLRVSREGREAALLQLRPRIPPGAAATRERCELSLPCETRDVDLEYPVRVPGRGRVQWEEIDGRLRAGLRLSCWQFTRRLPRPLRCTVYPDGRGEARQALQAFQRLLVGEKAIETAGGEGREFDSLRAYAIGDDLRRVDWKRSARGNGLLVRRYKPETHQRIAVAIDCGRRMGNRIGERLQLDYAADGAAHLLQLADSQDDEIGLFAFDHRVLSKLPCGKGARQERHIMEALLQLGPSELEADYQLLTEWAHYNKRRSLLVLITSVSNPVTLDTLQSALLPVRGKHLPLICAIADRDLEQLAEEPALNAAQAYIVAAAAEQLELVQSRLAALQRSGIDCIYCKPNALSAALRRKYWELKLSGRL